jgi:putative iron-regulated protein
MDAAKEAWLTARQSYGPTEAYRPYGAPIDDDNGPEGQLNACPLDE